MKNLEIICWLVASGLLFVSNVVSAYNHFFGGK